MSPSPAISAVPHLPASIAELWRKPALPDLLDEPIILLLMARDGVKRGDVITLVDSLRPRLAA